MRRILSIGFIREGVRDWSLGGEVGEKGGEKEVGEEEREGRGERERSCSDREDKREGLDREEVDVEGLDREEDEREALFQLEYELMGGKRETEPVLLGGVREIVEVGEIGALLMLMILGSFVS
jgi:hypothetical protein